MGPYRSPGEGTREAVAPAPPPRLVTQPTPADSGEWENVVVRTPQGSTSEAGDHPVTLAEAGTIALVSVAVAGAVLLAAWASGSWLP